MNDNNNASVLRDCVEFIQERKKEFGLGDAPFTGGDKEKSFGIDEKRIFRVPAKVHERKLAFVDGGTASILSGADFNISLNRVAGVLFKGANIIPLKKTPEVIEFFTATILEPTSDGKLSYNIQLFPREPSFTEFKNVDKLLKEYIDPLGKSGMWADLYLVASRDNKEIRIAKVYSKALDRINKEIFESDAKKLMKINHKIIYSNIG